MNTEQHEHRISQIIREACEEVGVELKSEPFMDANDELHIGNTYDRASAVLRKRERWAALSALSYWAAGATTGALFAADINILIFIPAFGTTLALSGVCLYNLLAWSRREPISENDLHWHIKSALTNKGYVVEFSGHQMRVWWRE